MVIKCKECGEEVFASHLREHWREKHPRRAMLVERWLENVDDRLAGLEKQIREQEGLE